jgi:uncharacterized membrane protein YbhN (UPF0104 family)
MSEEAERSRWSILRSVLAIVILATFLIWLVLYIDSHRSNFAKLLHVSPRELAGILALAFLSMGIRGFFTITLTAPLGARVKVAEGFLISMISTIGNYSLPMRGGIGLRALYLKKKHSIAIRDFAKISLARFGTIFFVDSILGLTALFLLWEKEGSLPGAIFSVLVSALFLSALIQISPVLPVGGRFCVFSRFMKKGAGLLGHEGVRKRLIFTAFANSSIRFCWILLCFHALSSGLSFYQGLLISSLIPLSMMVTLTPANLGVTEGLLIYVTGIFHISPSVAIMCSLLMRMSAIFWALVMIPFIWKPLTAIRNYRR